MVVAIPYTCENYPYRICVFCVLKDKSMTPESALLKRARRFEQNALAEIYDRYNPQLYRYAWRLLGRQDVAEECVAAAFDSFLNALKRGGGPKKYLRAYLYRIVHNWAADYYRRQPEAELPLDGMQLSDSENEPFLAVAQKNEVQAALAALETLTPEQRQVVVLKYLEGWSNAEVAQAMEKPVGAIKSLHHRAIQALRRALGSRRSEPDVRKE
jgi:RNA polymerase sigma-70 factor (ECF subfamily)